MKKKPTIASLKKRLTVYFNRYIRIRDCKGEWGGVCISCGKYFIFSKLQAGHFVPSTSSATRFDERNVNAQCIGCNMFLRGNLIKYFVAMERKYGREVVNELIRKKHQTVKWRASVLEDMIVEYKKKVKTLQDKYR